MAKTAVVINENKTTVLYSCDLCHRSGNFTVDSDKWKEYVWSGGFVQDLWPELTPTEREEIKMGNHPRCIDKLYDSIKED